MSQNTQQVIDAIFHDKAIQWAFDQQIKFAPPDDQIMADLGKPQIEPSDKADAMKTWLGRYKVWRGIRCANEISEEIVTFFTQKKTSQRLTSNESIIKEFKSLNSLLHNRLIQHNSHLNTIKELSSKNEYKDRSLLSLTSKALWAIYPDFIPIYDTFLFKAIGMLTKIDNLSSEPIVQGISKHDGDVEKYTKYVKGYMALYKMANKNIQSFRNRQTPNYPYDIRVFDKVLWAYGKPQYSFPD